YNYRSRDKLSRLLIVVGAFCICVVIEIMNAFAVFGKGATSSISAFWLYSGFGILSLAAFIFLVVGSLVWLYARDRHVAFLLFIFFFSVTVVFVSFASLDPNPLFYSLGKV